MKHNINVTECLYHLKRDNNIHRQDAVTFSFLGKLGSASAAELRKWKNCLKLLIREACNEREISPHPLIVGLAESGIIPSALFHQLLRNAGISADWICSTRRPSRGIHFNESHSHGPDHIIPLPHSCPTELWFVEDEITTGRTLLHLSLRLCRMMNMRSVRFFAVADSRSDHHKAQFRSVLKDHGIHYAVHTLVQMKRREENKSYPDISLTDGIGEGSLRVSHTESHLWHGKNWHFPRQRPALRNLSDVFFPPDPLLTGIFRTARKGSLLVVGEAVDIALGFVQKNTSLSFRHITLSPWKIDGKNIFNRLDICKKYYIYNYHSLKSPLYILNDPIDADIGGEAAAVLSKKGFFVRRLDI
ncbi:MAG: hypothetical protein BWK80_45175 [Desulfobacteraceae bacterium IS3]|nr:MAG: hypothetical protein BWK80_45175 [Desulfobacteraceae bacterium IS3]